MAGEDRNKTHVDSIENTQNDNDLKPVIHQGELDKWVKDNLTVKGGGLFGGLLGGGGKPKLDKYFVDEFLDKLRNAPTDQDRYIIAKEQVEQIKNNPIDHPKQHADYASALQKLTKNAEKREENIQRMAMKK